jgi:hypothetical protein
LRWIVDGVRGADDQQIDTTTVSTKPLYRGFCSICGSKIHAKTPLNENIISVPAGLLDSANTPSPDVSSKIPYPRRSLADVLQPETSLMNAPWKPHKEQFCDYRQDWVPEFGCVSGGRYEKGTGGKEVSSLGKGEKL